MRTTAAMAVALLLALTLALGISGCESNEARQERENAALQTKRELERSAQDEAARRSPTYTAAVVCTNCGAGRG